MTPYRTHSGLGIGSRFEPSTPPAYTSADHDRVQAALLAANRSRFEDSQTMRLAPLRRPRVIPVGGGMLRKLWLILRDTARYLRGNRP